MTGGRLWFENPSEKLIVSSTYDEALASGTGDSLSDLAYFTGLETLWLENSGADLNWMPLAQLSSLKKVYAGAEMEKALSAALAGTQVELNIFFNALLLAVFPGGLSCQYTDSGRHFHQKIFFALIYRLYYVAM